MPLRKSYPRWNYWFGIDANKGTKFILCSLLSVIEPAVLLSDVSITMHETIIPSIYPFNVFNDTELLVVPTELEQVPMERKASSKKV